MKYYSPGASINSDYAFVCDYCEASDGRPTSFVEESGAAICVPCAANVLKAHNACIDAIEVRRASIPEALREAVFERDGRSCRSCGSLSDLSLDHVDPFCRGGATTFENLQTLCRRCNSRKGSGVAA